MEVIGSATFNLQLLTFNHQQMKLQLTIKKHWFDLIKSGEKTEEYRELKPYYVVRLLEPKNGKKHNIKETELMINALEYHYHPKWDKELITAGVKKYESIVFRNGRSASAPTIEVEYKGLKVAKGKLEWGAEPNKIYFVLVLGKVLKTRNL